MFLGLCAAEKVGVEVQEVVIASGALVEVVVAFEALVEAAIASEMEVGAAAFVVLAGVEDGMLVG